MAGGSGMRGGQPPRYRKRRPLPALIFLFVLGVAAGIVWLRVLDSDVRPTGATSCNTPAGPPAQVEGQPPTTLGQPLADDALDRTTPVAPAQALVRVVNASPQRGQAAEVTEALRQLGFAQIVPAANDALYASGELACRAQIRFGQQGSAAARTLSLIEPCAQLVRDDRQDATVDLAIGQRFDDLRPNAQARQLLQQLTTWLTEHPEAQGGLQGDQNAGPDLDPAMLAAARKVPC